MITSPPQTLQLFQLVPKPVASNPKRTLPVCWSSEVIMTMKSAIHKLEGDSKRLF